MTDLAEALSIAPAPRARRRHDEDDAQTAIVTYLRTVLPADHRVFAIPNGGARSKSEAARLKRTGVMPGVPDLCILGPLGKSLWLETKAAKGVLSKPQREMRDWMALIGVPLAVVRDIDEVRAALRQWGLSTKEAT